MRARHLALVVVLAALFAATLPFGNAEPVVPFRLESRIPATTLAFAAAQEIGTWDQRARETALGKLLDDPEMAAFLAPLRQWLGRATEGGEMSGPFREVPPIVWDALKQLQGIHGQAAIALVELDLRKKRVEAVMSLDFGPHAEEFVAFLGRLQSQVDPQGEQLKTTQKDGRTVWSIDTGDFTITATTRDTTFVVATSPELLERTLAAPATSGTLATSQEFTTASQKATSGKSAFLAWANVKGLVGSFGADAPPEMTQMFAAMGLDSVRGAAYGVSFSGDGFLEGMYFDAPGATRGLLAMYRMKPLASPRLLPLVPATAFYYAEASADLGQMWKEMRTMMSAVDARMMREIDETVQRLTAEIGVDLEKEVLPGLAEGYGLYAGLPETGGLYPEVAVMLIAKDPAAFEATMDRLTMGIVGALNERGRIIASTRTIDYHGKKLHLFEMQKAQGSGIVPFTPTWCFFGDRLLITAVPHTMKEIVLRAEAGDKIPGLTSQEDFKAVWAQKPKDAGSVAYMDLQGLLSLGYDTGVPLLQTAVKPNVLKLPFTVDWAQLPAARTVRPYFRSLGAFASGNDQGISVSIHSPVPIVPAIFAVAVGATFALSGGRSSAMRRSRAMEPEIRMPEEEGEWLERQQALSQVAGLVEKVSVFVADKGSVPVDLGDLVQAELLDRVPSDPWGRPFRLRVLNAKERSFVIESAGKDGQFGTADDVTSRNGAAEPGVIAPPR